jgi:hypothetical protein
MKKILAKTFVVLTMLVLSVKIIDLMIGILVSENNSIAIKSHRSLVLREHSPNLFINIKPGDQYMKGVKTLIQKDYVLRTDLDGFIIGPKDLKRSKEKVGIIFFGGSSTECGFVEETKRFPYLVSQTLNIRTLNAGYSGNHSMHSNLALIGKGVKYKPQFVVFMHAGNDLATLSKTLSYWNPESPRYLMQNSDESIKSFYDLARSVKNFIIPNIWLRFGYYFQNQVTSIVSDEWAGFRDSKHGYTQIQKIIEKEFSASVKTFVSNSRNWGIEPILMTQFSRFYVDDLEIRNEYERSPQPLTFEEYVNLFRESNNIVRNIAKSERVLLIDLEAEIPARPEFIYDAMHLNSKGSELVAKIISAKLETAQFLQ